MLENCPQALRPLEVKSGADNEPFATRTRLGWMLHGPVGDSSTTKHVKSNFVCAQLEDQVEKFWRLESAEVYEDNTCASVNDQHVINLWEDNVKHLDNKHYELPIAFKTFPPRHVNNRELVEKRLENLRNRLQKNPDLHQAYTSSMTELIDKGYAEKVEINETESKQTAIWYLPHHPVYNLHKPNKVRIVFDCSAKKLGTSLNEQVLQGPDLTNSLLGVLMRFRQHSVALMADIESMFHQVHVPLCDRDVLRFLWWTNGDLNKEAQTYRMTVHLFGGNWSPSCCNFALKRTAKEHQNDCDALAVDTVLRNFYVDDCLKSVEDEEKAIPLVKNLQHLLSKGGFRLTKWLSNNRRVLASITEKERAKDVKCIDLNYEALPVERALGVYWDVDQDCFRFKITPKDKPMTRRGLLSIVSSVYDPLGFVSPYSLLAKKLIQDLCRRKLDWDEPLLDEDKEQWSHWYDNLPKIEQFKVERCIQPCAFGTIVQIQLHHFSDASVVAYGAVSYLRLLNMNGQVFCRFILAKSKLAPLKQMTIPRLELTAAALSVKLDKVIRREIDLPIEKSIFWTDSTLVLQYIQNEDKRFHTYVANRVALIHEGSTPSQWRYVDSSSNPADDAPRGLNADEMISKGRWLEGPEFLVKDPINWPTSPLKKLQDTDPEIKLVKVCLVEQEQTVSSIDQLFTRRSSWLSLKKDVAWILRLKDCLHAKTCTSSGQPVKGPLTVHELHRF